MSEWHVCSRSQQAGASRELCLPSEATKEVVSHCRLLLALFISLPPCGLRMLAVRQVGHVTICFSHCLLLPQNSKLNQGAKDFSLQRKALDFSVFQRALLQSHLPPYLESANNLKV